MGQQVSGDGNCKKKECQVMNGILRTAAILCMVIAAGHSACSGSEVNDEAAGSGEKGTKTGSEHIVTFVELGSVNCVPCRMMQPVMEEIEKEYGSRVKVVFYDVWTPEGEPYAEKYQIRAIPTQVFLDKDGKEFFRHTGFFPKEEIVKVLKKGGI